MKEVFENSRERLSLISKLSIKSYGTASSHCNDMIHHIPLRTFHFDWFGRLFDFDFHSFFILIQGLLRCLRIGFDAFGKLRLLRID